MGICFKVKYQVKKSKCKTLYVVCSQFSLKSKQMDGKRAGYTPKMFTVVFSGW